MKSYDEDILIEILEEKGYDTQGAVDHLWLDIAVANKAEEAKAFLTN